MLVKNIPLSFHQLDNSSSQLSQKQQSILSCKLNEIYLVDLTRYIEVSFIYLLSSFYLLVSLLTSIKIKNNTNVNKNNNIVINNKNINNVNNIIKIKNFKKLLRSDTIISDGLLYSLEKRNIKR